MLRAVKPHKWSIRLLLDELDASAISPSEHLLALYASRGVQNLQLGALGEEDEAGVALTIELEAGTWHEARVLAQHLVGLVFESADLAPRELPVVWVAPLADRKASSLRFLEQARELLDQDLFELAVVAAQIHLEAHVRTLIDRAVAEDPSALTRTEVPQRHWTLTQRRGRRVLEALFGLRFADFPRWPQFRAHLDRRNGIAHQGVEVPEELARESVELVHELWLWLSEALAPATARHLPARTSAPGEGTPDQLLLGGCGAAEFT